MNYFKIIDILDEIIFHIDTNSLVNFMLTNKSLLYLIGQSYTWYPNIKTAKNPNKYKKLCKIIEHNPFIKENIYIKKYYGEHYYCFRFKNFMDHYNGYINLFDIMIYNKKYLYELTPIIKLIFKKQYRESESYNRLISEKNFIKLYVQNDFHILCKKVDMFVELFNNIDTNILNKIYITSDSYQLKRLLINVNNDEYTEKIISHIGYLHDFATSLGNENVFILPRKFVANNSKFETSQVDNYGYSDIDTISVIDNYTDLRKFNIRCSCEVCIDQRYYSLYNYFSILSNRLNINQDVLYTSIRYILRMTTFESNGISLDPETRI